LRSAARTGIFIRGASRGGVWAKLSRNMSKIGSKCKFD